MVRKPVVLITGAGGGMGRVASQVFAREGALVAALDVDGVLAEVQRLIALPRPA